MTQLAKRFDAFDLLFKNLFDDRSIFTPLDSAKINHPVDIYETESGLNIEVAGTGLTKEDVRIEIEGDSIRISYDKTSDEIENKSYLYKGISKRSFNLAYRVSNKFNLQKAEAEMENGLLKISIPVTSETVTKTLIIK